MQPLNVLPKFWINTEEPLSAAKKINFMILATYYVFHLAVCLSEGYVPMSSLLDRTAIAEQDE